MIRFLTLLFVCLMLFGCLTLEQSIRLTSGDTMVAGYVYTYDTANEPTIKAALNELKQLDFRFYDEELVRKEVEERGLELIQYRKQIRNGRTTVTVSVLTRSFRKLLKQGVFTGLKVTRGENNSLTLSLPVEGLSREKLQRLKTLCPDFKMTLTVSVPETIRETNGQRVSDDTAVWEYTLGDTPVEPTISW